MATNTHIPLDKVTVANTTTNTITFSSIPQTYTDLVLIMSVGNNANSGAGGVQVRYNGSSSSLYSWTYLVGNGSTTISGRNANQTYFDIGIDSNTTNYSVINTQVLNYANSTTWKTAISRGNASTNEVSLNTSLWRSTAAISSITVLKANDYFKSGSTFSLYGIKAEVGGSSAKATGGTVTSDATYWYHTFTTSGTFVPNQSLTADYLVIAGGGGASGGIGSGGGAGGLRSTVTATGGGGTLESALSLTAGNYSVIVGAGGAGGTSTVADYGLVNNSNGTPSTFHTISTVGGGAGGAYVTGYRTGITGGSGGGGSGGPSGTMGSGGSGTANQGYSGGAGANSLYGCGGGGGAGAAGTSGTTGTGGNGGSGIAISALATATSTGVSNYYAGGGGGASYTAGVGTGGSGGGGSAGAANGNNNGTAGTANTGSGGGAGSYFNNGGSSGGNGGSGLVIVRYAK